VAVGYKTLSHSITVVLLAALNHLNDFRLHNLVRFVVLGGKLADVDMVAPERDSLANARVRGGLFFNNLEE
jgi:hypothetical protein